MYASCLAPLADSPGRTKNYSQPLYHATLGTTYALHYYRTYNRKEMKTYFFKAGNQAALAFDVNIDGLCTGDAINNYTLHRQAEYHAKFLAYHYGVPVKFWPKEKPENTVVIEYMPEHLEAVAV